MFRRIFGRRTAGAPPTDPASGRVGSLLSPEELERIGTEGDPLRDYEAGLERNLAAAEAERRGDVDAAVALYEANVSGGFVGSYPYERLATVYETRRAPREAVRVLAAFVRLAESGTLPRGAQRSAERKLPQIQARLSRLEAAVRERGGPGDGPGD